MKIPAIKKTEVLTAAAGVSALTKVEFERGSRPALLKEPKQFWDVAFVANEAHLLGEITHPRVRRRLAYDAVAHRLLLEFIEGMTLQELVLAGVTVREPARTHRLLQVVAETLADLHAGIFCRRPVVHNDVKTANILVPAAAPEEILLIDFSHSYFKDTLPAFINDREHHPIGTAKYTAPEKWDGDYGHGVASDVFAFGVTAFYACTGKHPFDGDPATVEKQIREAEPPSLAKLGARVPRNIWAVILSCLTKDPARRPSMEKVAKYFAESASVVS
jgi:serine/threonine protein kinase